MSGTCKKPAPEAVEIAPQDRPLSPADRARIHGLAERGHSVQQIGAITRVRYDRIEAELAGAPPADESESPFSQLRKLRGERRSQPEDRGQRSDASKC